MSSAPPKNNTAIDTNFMRIALSLAERQLGCAWPNPSVGAVLVKNGHIIAQGATAAGGRPHGETVAIEQAGANAHGATLYVTLEPCSHQGKTPPCTHAILAAGIRRCVIACRDPNPLVNGQGIRALQEAGLEVVEGICEDEARALNRGFFTNIEKKRPYIALKLATSLDGKLAFPQGDSRRWITSEAARHYGQLLRSQYDAIVTGIGTVLADDPLLTCRLPGLEHRSPVRIVFDSNGRLPAGSQLVQTAKQYPVWQLTHTSTTRLPITHLSCTTDAKQRIDLDKALELLAQQGITRLLVEAGAALSHSFLASGYVDRIYWFRAPIMIGEGGLAVPVSTTLAPWRHTRHIALPPDQLDIFDV
ncbi:MAG: bifunctional diaminohydroxyphosphoribosylaminopyrimidine deaminase/5-amino-6-(5-phosphoribosylamino)uracil reductase RibD [Rickettsiales bacterium]|nr:bifunctional diaminohydroxyphosphoribosylaminopyrimidine deaminase/5-amino-6-(5-phosphoribosylamino)uracil reductase RibD [Rickettsiales bacterium]